MCECKTTKHKQNEKIKVTDIDIIVSGNQREKPYYEVKYKEVGKDHYSVGYSSYDLNTVVDWKEECFELMEE